MSAPLKASQDSARCGVFDVMCQALRSKIEDGTFANEHHYNAALALGAAGFSQAEIIEYLDDVCAAVIPSPGDWQSYESIVGRIISKIEKGQ